jgi:two-component system response regulator AtoC
MREPRHLHRALVVEDDGAVRELLAEMLELRGLEVQAVASAEGALRALRSSALPDVIVLDRRMPGMSGDDLLRRLKAQPEWSRILVAVVSGMPRGERELAAEPDAYLEKPFDADRFDEALSHLGEPPS